jgi:hypothetical protein
MIKSIMVTGCDERRQSAEIQIGSSGRSVNGLTERIARRDVGGG